jgi:xylan 1,4-beta-xylosidase
MANLRSAFLSNHRHPSRFLVALGLCLVPALLSAQEPVTVRVDASLSQAPLARIWSYFGYDEPNYTYSPHGQELIAELAALSQTPVYLRTHNLLTTGDGTPALKWGSTNAYTEDASGRPIYDWTIVDEIFDTYLHAGAEPFVEIGFMPKALSTHPEPYQHHWPDGPLDTGWSYPPKDYAKWAELVRQWVLHCVARYGRSEVEKWHWEVWNEPDIFYWHGTPEGYDKLYDFTADAVKKALPTALVGGPATTGPANPRAAAFLRQFLEHCAHGTNYATGQTGAPLDFITFHAKGAAAMADGHVRMGIQRNLLDAERGFEIVASFPMFAHLPVVLSESDPEGCAACSIARYPQAAYRNTPWYASYTATSMANLLQLAERNHIQLQGALTWAFQFENQPYFAGLRTLATRGIDKPILNLFRMLGLMQGEQVKAESTGAVTVDNILQSGVRGTPDVDAIAARADHSLTVLLWNYHDDGVEAPDAPVQLSIAGLPPAQARVLLRHYRIDQEHSDAFALWQEMDSPQNPTAEQYARLKSAGQLQLMGSPLWIESANGKLELKFPLPRQAVSLVELNW